MHRDRHTTDITRIDTPQISHTHRVVVTYMILIEADLLLLSAISRASTVRLYCGCASLSSGANTISAPVLSLIAKCPTTYRINMV